MDRRQTLVALATAGITGRALAADGVSDGEVLLGQTGILSGPLGTTINAMLAGAKAAFEAANAGGGIAGRSVRLLSLDDELQPLKAVAHYKRLLEQDKVFAMFGCVGSGTTAAAADVLKAADAVMVGGYAVADSARNRTGDNGFYVRATSQREVEALVRHLTTLGITRVALAHLDNPGGQEVLKLVQAELGRHKLEPVAAAAVKGDGSNMDAAVQALVPATPQAVLMYLSGKLPADLMTGLRQANSFPSFYGMSIVSGETVAKLLGERVRGLAIAQVMPFPWREVPELQPYQKALGAVALNYYTLEGWIAAQVVIDALKRCGRDLTRPKFAAALRQVKLRFGPMEVDFTRGRQTGSSFVELVQVRADGSFVR